MNNSKHLPVRAPINTLSAYLALPIHQRMQHVQLLLVAYPWIRGVLQRMEAQPPAASERSLSVREWAYWIAGEAGRKLNTGADRQTVERIVCCALPGAELDCWC